MVPIPDIERYRHHGVEHYGIGEEDKECNDSSTTEWLCGDECVPGQVLLKFHTCDGLPNPTRYHTEQAHGQQEEHNLKQCSL